MMHVGHMIVSSTQIHAVCDFRQKFHFRNNKISNLTTKYQRMVDIFTIILDVDHGGLEREGLQNLQKCNNCTWKKIRFFSQLHPSFRFLCVSGLFCVLLTL